MRPSIPITVLAGCLILAGCGTSAKTGSSVPVKVTGTETITGHTPSTANHPLIPLTASGVIADTGSIRLTGSGNKAGTGELRLAKGDITVGHSKTSGGNAPYSYSPRTCAVVFREHGTYTILGARSTGAYKDASGHGTFTVTFAARMPRIRGSRKCNTSNSAQPVSGSSDTVFTVAGPLTIRK